MPEQTPVPVHASNAFEDLSGISTSAFSNPYDALIAACEEDPVWGSVGTQRNPS
jgi:vesicle-fusing ATPase